MYALTLDFEARKVTPAEAPPPVLERDDEVLFRVLEVGLCGTDRSLVRFEKGRPPASGTSMVVGHEALGRVERVGPAVDGLAPGDLVVPVIRRRCPGPCANCDRGRSDLCLTGRFTERGIHGADGYFCEFAVDAARHLVRVPAALESSAVLLEPMSVVEKSLDAAFRAYEGEPRNAVVIGAGAIGILTALALRVRGLAVSVKSLEDEDTPRVGLLRRCGVEYLRGTAPSADLIFEASGANESAFEAVKLLAPCGVAIILGAMNGKGEFPFRDLVLGNRKVIGIVNAPRPFFEAAIEDLRRFEPQAVDGLIERRRRRHAVESLHSPPPPQAVKLVHTLED